MLESKRNSWYDMLDNRVQSLQYLFTETKHKATFRGDTDSEVKGVCGGL